VGIPSHPTAYLPNIRNDMHLNNLLKYIQ